MPRKVKRVKVRVPTTNWWAGVFVLARRSEECDYTPGNVFWRRASSEHEAMLGIEEWEPDEPILLPMTKKDAQERAKRRNAMERRFFDIRLRMLYRTGEARIPQKEPECVWVETTPFPAGFSPTRSAVCPAN